MPMRLALAMIWWALTVRSDVRLAAACAAGFHCMLRTIEICTVTPSCICVAADASGVIALPWTKMGQQKGTQEMVTFSEPLVGRLLMKAAAVTPAASPLIASVPAFRADFAAACNELGVADLQFKPYSLRRGGASYDFIAYGDIMRTLWRGRWSGCQTGRIYVQEGVAVQTQMRMSAATERAMDVAVTALAAWQQA